MKLTLSRTLPALRRAMLSLQDAYRRLGIHSATRPTLAAAASTQNLSRSSLLLLKLRGSIRRPILSRQGQRRHIGKAVHRPQGLCVLRGMRSAHVQAEMRQLTVRQERNTGRLGGGERAQVSRRLLQMWSELARLMARFLDSADQGGGPQTCDNLLSGSYLMRDDGPDAGGEKIYCVGCYDIRAKEEANAARERRVYG